MFYYFLHKYKTFQCICSHNCIIIILLSSNLNIIFLLIHSIYQNYVHFIHPSYIILIHSDYIIHQYYNKMNQVLIHIHLIIQSQLSNFMVKSSFIFNLYEYWHHIFKGFDMKNIDNIYDIFYFFSNIHISFISIFLYYIYIDNISLDLIISFYFIFCILF
jgi:hypothetical protein